MVDILQPLNKCQALVRRESVVNLENFRKLYIRRKWKLTYRIVSFCNHLTRSFLKKDYLKTGETSRQYDSDNEDVSFKRRPSRPRRRSSTS
ncbi:hypothetical protein chiPu_0018470 [Chiloscyllium punctatum]|uniref:Uncharacterized protein n=1 Tax=Chiloscyllium punctatum TaxID=137246 RepID=A0A401RNJ7_CHIPU|nr:hypothetical protein [Chiloscyllium punctatum]